MKKNISPIIGILYLSLIAVASQDYNCPDCNSYKLMHDEKSNYEDKPGVNQTPRFDPYVRIIDTVFKPEYLDTPAAIEITFDIPLGCMHLKVQLFEYADPKDLGLGLPAQQCELHKISEHFQATCYLLNDKRKLIKVEATSYKGKDNRWIVTTIWNNLMRGGAYYRVGYDIDSLDECETKYDISLLRDILRRNRCRAECEDDLVHYSKSNTPAPAKESEDFIWRVIIWVSHAIILASVLYYWIAKYWKLLSIPFSRKARPWTSEKSMKLLPGKESNQILLIYERDSDSPFVEEIENLKRSLEQRCSGCEVRDVYASAEFDRISEIGAPGWVQELLDSGSKIVWIDTPQFRSRCKNGNDHFQREDFDHRDDAVQTAVDAAVKSLQNFSLQYRRHFVVRIKGFEVPDGCEDPLQVVTRHARYYIPDHLAILCNDLKLRR